LKDPQTGYRSSLGDNVILMVVPVKENSIKTPAKIVGCEKLCKGMLPNSVRNFVTYLRNKLGRSFASFLI